VPFTCELVLLPCLCLCCGGDRQPLCSQPQQSPTLYGYRKAIVNVAGIKKPAQLKATAAAERVFESWRLHPCYVPLPQVAAAKKKGGKAGGGAKGGANNTPAGTRTSTKEVTAHPEQQRQQACSAGLSSGTYTARCMTLQKCLVLVPLHLHHEPWHHKSFAYCQQHVICRAQQLPDSSCML
jgi:hypothetical protein